MMSQSTSDARSQVKSASADGTKPLKGKVAVITGSTSGIGLGIARQLAEQGASVVLNGFGDTGTIEELRSEIESSAGVKVRYHGADVSKPEEVRALIKDAVDQLGGVDILVNNAGIQYVSPVEQFPEEKWDAIIAINLSSAFHAIKASLPHMRKGGWGRIINIASTHGLVASVDKVAYVTAKHGLVGMTKVVALEYAESNITCNAVCPGFVRTPLVEAQIAALAQRQGISLEQATVELLSEKQPTKRFTEVEQLAALVLFLCSEAAANITGSTQVVDGGWTAR
jgi:3-hydroxybutyrate dehydrogenase